MITYIDIRFSFYEIFASIEWVPNEGKHTEDPRPEPKELITDPGVLSSDKKRKDNTGKQHQHKDGEDQKTQKI